MYTAVIDSSTAFTGLVFWSFSRVSQVGYAEANTYQKGKMPPVGDVTVLLWLALCRHYL